MLNAETNLMRQGYYGYGFFLGVKIGVAGYYAGFSSGIFYSDRFALPLLRCCIEGKTYFKFCGAFYAGHNRFAHGEMAAFPPGKPVPNQS